MPDGSFPVEIVKGMPVVAAPEEIDITNAAALRATLLNAAANGHDTLVVDMTRTQFCDSSGLHTLIAAHKRAEAEGREVLLVIPSTTVLRVFALTGMDRMIPTSPPSPRPWHERLPSRTATAARPSPFAWELASAGLATLRRACATAWAGGEICDISQ